MPRTGRTFCAGARATLWLTSALLAASLAACEGDDPGSPPTPAPKPTSPAAPPAGEPAVAFAPAADRLCSASQAAQEDIRRRSGRQLTLGDRARLLVEVAPLRVELATDLAALEPAGSQERAVRRLLEAARIRGEASERAGELYETAGPRRQIAAAAALEHDQRERFVEIARGLGLRQCAERLPAADRREVAAAIEAALSATDPAARCDQLGERYLQERFGDRAACVTDRRASAPAAAVTVSEIEGMAGVFALARAEASGGAEPGGYRVRLTYERGDYRIDKLD